MKRYLNQGPWDALLFDIDNTLYRNDAYVDAQVAAIIGRYAQREGVGHDVALSRVDAARHLVEHQTGARPSLSNALVTLGVSIRESVGWREEEIEPESWLAPDATVQSIIETLARRWTLIALTNNPASIGARSLHALGLAPHFHATVGLDTRLESKPDWGPFAAALELAETVPERAVMVGDRYEVDLEPFIARGGSGLLIEAYEDLYSLPAVLAG